ncbi:MAG: ABC transporter substrate-binding protein [Bacteroidales bacterium]|jgi:iron complex transport system substrate-binding protein|nr:ABC transporter substrate-binding protein [Bacteroidales bacterium]
MQKQITIIIVSIFVILLMTPSCNFKENEISVPTSDSSLLIKYATGFTISYFPDYKRIEVFNPWEKTSTLGIYYLVSDNSVQTPQDGIRLQTPLNVLGITSCTYIEVLNLLGVLSTVKGATTPELIYNETLQTLYQKGKLTNLGDAFRINFETLLLLNPEALMITSYNNNRDENTRRLQSAGVKLIYNNEWTETSLLARAEWIKFIAAFYDKENFADSIFNIIENNYIQLKTLANKVTKKQSIISGGNFKGTWYMPSGKVFMSKLYTDAGGDYYYSNDTTTGSLPLSFETVLLHQQHADVWLNAQANSIEELLMQDQRHGLFDAVKNNRVYNFNARSNKQGANDFWESGITHPDVVLSDVIWALYPELLPDYRPFYIKQLK